MRIRAVRLTGAGPFTKGVALEGLSGGLDVLAGPNELGKSTLFRSLEAVFLRPFQSGGKWLDALKARGASEMVVEADFEADGVAWRIAKRYGRAATAILSRLDTGEEVARKHDADERLAALIGARPEAPGRLGLLWVGQGDALLPSSPDAGKERGERSALLAAIEREVESVAGGADARIVRAKVRTLLDEMTTPANRSRPRRNGAFDRALRRRDELAAAHEEARKAALQSAGWRDELARIAERRAIMADPVATTVRKQRLDASAAAVVAGHEAVAALKLIAAGFETRAQLRARAQEALSAFDGSLQELADLDAAEAEQQRLRSAAASALEAAAAACEAATRELAHAQVEERAGAAHLAGLRARELRRRLEAAGSAQRRVRELEAVLAANRVTRERLGALEREERQIALLSARLAATEPRVRIDYGPRGAGRIRLDGAPVADGSELRVSSPLVLDIEGIGRMTVNPGEVVGAEDDRQDLAAHRATLDELLASCGVANMIEARSRAEQRQAAGNELEQARTALAVMAPDGVAALQSEIQRAFSTAAPAAEGAGGAGGAGGEGGGIEAEAGPQSIAAAQARLAELHGRSEIARERQRAAEKEKAEREKEALRLATLANERARQRAAVAARLPPPAARAQERLRLADAAAKAATEARDAERALALAREVAPDAAAMARLEQEHRAATHAQQEAESGIAAIELQTARLEGALQEADERGSDVEAGRLAGELEVAAADVARISSRVGALALLETTLLEAEAVARDRFLAPVVQRLAPFLDIAFPQARLVLGEGFSVEAIERGGALEAIGALSQGTQEQIAVLVRCAFGRLLAQSGTPVPLVLDDALVYADDERIERMFAVLELASRAHQVLVLTCRERTFERLGGNRLRLAAWRQES